MIKRAIVYCRVSTDEQAASGYSLEHQSESCHKYADEYGMQIVAEFADDHTGTVPIEMRPEGTKAFAMLHSGLADVLVCYSMDRLARPPEDGDEWDMPVLIRGLAKTKKEIHTVKRGQLKTDFASLLIAMLDARGAGEERRKIIERTTNGKNSKAKKNKVVGTGRPPYGYLYSNDHLEVVPSEAEVVRMIFSWYNGDHKNSPLPANAIAIRLSEMRIETPYEKYGVKKKRLPGIWSASTVKRILGYEVYAGVLHYGRRIGANGNGGKRKASETIKIDVPAIISASEWKLAQERRTLNAEMALRNCKNVYLLRGLVTCGCGRKMVAYQSHGHYRYRCSIHQTRYTRLEGRDCYEKMVDGNWLEDQVWQYVYGILTSNLEIELLKAQAEERQAQEPKIQELEIVKRMIAEAEEDVDAIVRALKIARGRVSEKFVVEQEEANRRCDDLVARKDRLERELEQGALSDAQIQSIVDYRNLVLKGLANTTKQDRRRMYEILRVSVTVKDGHAQVSCRLDPDTFAAHTA
ncbi:hypothetical protein TFLX_03343 [Thermoflexales bacterium]|nr:hypothetical protein TFLX_03343 [Thermoflexales bacterium]